MLMSLSLHFTTRQTTHKLRVMRIKTLIFLFVLSCIAGVWDYTVREVDSVWTENPFSQLLVFLSPIIHVTLLTALFLRFKHLPIKAPRKAIQYASILLCIVSIFVLAQVYVNAQAVGSARYSVVYPLYFSGIPFSFLAWFVYFSSDRNYFKNTIVAFTSVIWLITPVSIDLLYTVHGGYRGPLAHFGVPVLGTTHDLLLWFAAIACLLSPFIAIAVLVSFAYFVFEAAYSEKLPVFAVGMSLFTLTAQLWNWGSFVWD